MIEKSDGNMKSLVGFVYLFSDKTATALKSTVLVVHPFHAILLNVSAG